MNKKIQYVKYNLSRKKNFRIKTSIMKEGNNLFVIKEPLGEDSLPFFESLSVKYKLLNQESLPFKINKILQQNSRGKNLVFEFIEGETLLSILKNRAETLDKNGIKSIFMTLEKLIEELPSTESIPIKEFSEIFGTFKNKIYKNTMLGILDLNLDNLIIDKKSKINLIDFEWLFQFPIPKRYIFYRAIYYAYMQLRKTLSNVLSIEKIEQEFNFSESEIKEYLLWESCFQEYVYGTKIDEKELFEYRKNYQVIDSNKNSIILSIDEYQALLKQINELENQISGSKKIIKQSLIELEEFKAFKKGIFWKLLGRYRKIRSNISNGLIRKDEK